MAAIAIPGKPWKTIQTKKKKFFFLSNHEWRHLILGGRFAKK